MIRFEMTSQVRAAAVAGAFYPGTADQLGSAVDELLSAPVGKYEAGGVKALIAPHAGYRYSGPIAASAFAPLSARKNIQRVVVLGPSHYVAFPGIALTRSRAYRTPLGEVSLDVEAMSQLTELPQVRCFEPAHANEHSIEVELPFLQRVLGDFQLVPLVTGDASDAQVAEVIDLLWGGPETLFVVSSDLSHFYDYETARALDEHTASAVEKFQPEEIHVEHACGRVAIRGWLHATPARKLRARTVDLRNSGDTAGSRERVVGYGAFAFTADDPRA